MLINFNTNARHFSEDPRIQSPLIGTALVTAASMHLLAAMLILISAAAAKVRQALQLDAGIPLALVLSPDLGPIPSG